MEQPPAESIDGPEYEEGSVPVLRMFNIARHIRNYKNGWRLDPLSFRPLHDDRDFRP